MLIVQSLFLFFEGSSAIKHAASCAALVPEWSVKLVCDCSLDLQDERTSLGRNSAASTQGRRPVRVQVHRKLHKDLSELCQVQTLPGHQGHLPRLRLVMTVFIERKRGFQRHKMNKPD